LKTFNFSVPVFSGSNFHYNRDKELLQTIIPLKKGIHSAILHCYQACTEMCTFWATWLQSAGT